MKIKSKDELLVKSFVQRVSSATTFSKRYKSVSRILEMRPKLTEDQWIRVWRGLYYSIWYSEMTKGCDILAQKIGTHDDLNMILTGFKALTNDWFGIDVFRLDKYMFLVRVMINTSIKLQIKQLISSSDSQNSDSNETLDSNVDNQKNGNENELTTEVVKEVDNKTVVTNNNEENKTQKKNKTKKKFTKRRDNFKKEIEFGIEFRAKIIDNILKSVKSSIGLTLHITDIFIDELFEVLSELKPNIKNEEIICLYFDILLPLIRVMAVIEDHRILSSVKQNIFDKFKNKVLISESIENRKQFLQRFIDAMVLIGGNESIGRRNRDSIYDIIGVFKTKLNQLNTTNGKILKRKKTLGKGRHKKVKYELTTSSPFVTSIVPIAVI